MIAASPNAIFSALMVAADLGVISPKIKIKIVRIPVARPTKVAVLVPAPSWAAILVASIVDNEDALRLTILLPIRMALSILDGLSVSSLTRMARLSPSSARPRIRILLTQVNAVSADEKKADKASKITRIRSCIASLESKKSSPLYVHIWINFI